MSRNKRNKSRPTTSSASFAESLKPLQAELKSATPSPPDPAPETWPTQTEATGTPVVEKESTSTTSPASGPSCDVVFIPAARALAYWPFIREHLWKAYERFPGEITEGAVLQRLVDGRSQLVVVYRDGFIGAALTQIEQYAEFDALVVAALGGDDFEAWREELDRVLEKFARFHNCTRIEFHGRRGWEKRLPNYKVYRVMMMRTL